MSEYRDKLLGISAPRRLGQSERRVEEHDGTRVETVEHWDGRRDATVTPDVVRYGARVHRTGKRTGEVAEVRTLDRREREERYGVDG
jgi:hypothetical protein